jgi:hypothetical protein
LRMLDIEGTQISDAGLVHLQRMKQLHSVNLSKTKATAAGINALRAAMPRLETCGERLGDPCPAMSSRG